MGRFARVGAFLSAAKRFLVYSGANALINTRGLVWWPLFAALRLSGRKAGVILLYHDIGDRDGNPDGELVPPISQARFASQLRHLSRHYRIVGLDEVQAVAANRRRFQRFPIAITFDDDLGHHVTHALPVLGALDAPATFFLCGSFLDEPRDYWWQRLQRAVDDGADVASLVGVGSIFDQGQVMEAMAPDVRDEAATNLASLVNPPMDSEMLTIEGAKQLTRIGFHTKRHDPLTRLNDLQLRRALDDGRAELAEMAGYPLEAIAYPHGHYDERVVKAARQHRFSIGVTCDHRAVTPHADPLVLGRYTPQVDASPGQFAFDVARTLLLSPPRVA